MTEDEAVVVTRRAYEARATEWAARDLDRSYARLRIAEMASLLDRGRLEGPVLDLGCGPGFDSALMAERGWDVVGLDVTRAMLDIARASVSRLMPVHGDSRRLPFAGGSFRGVWASASLLHLPKAQAPLALAEIARVLKPAGVFYSGMKEGDQDELEQPTATSSIQAVRWFAHYRSQEWASMLEAAGFSIEGQETGKDSRPGYPAWIVTFAVKK